MDNRPTDNPVLAQVVRSGLAESGHRGAVVAVGPDGSLLQAETVRQTGPVPMRAGAVDVPVFPRSSNKPMQAAAMLTCGLGAPLFAISLTGLAVIPVAIALLGVPGAQACPRSSPGRRSSAAANRSARSAPSCRSRGPDASLQLQAPKARLKA